MRIELFDKLCCPFDQSELTLEIIKEQDGEIIEGIMTCPTCGRYYPIIYGIPIMSPDEYREKSMELPMLERWGLQIAEDDSKFELASSEKTKELEN